MLVCGQNCVGEPVMNTVTDVLCVFFENNILISEKAMHEARKVTGA